MAGRRGGSKARGIRKKKGGARSNKKNPNRQRLAKVVAREEARDAAVERRASHVERTPPAAVEVPEFVARRAMEEDVAEEEATRERNETRARAARAYEALVGGVSGARDTDGTSVTVEDSKGAEKSDYGDVPAHEDGNRGPLKNQVMQDVAAQEKDAGWDADCSGEAAARENAHFGRTVVEEEAARLEEQYYAACSVASAPGGARVHVSARGDEALRGEVINGERLCAGALGVQPSVLARWAQWKEGLRVDRLLSRTESVVVRSIRSYADVLVCGGGGEARLRELSVAHCLGHALRARARVLRNNARVAAEEELEDDAVRDQGYARARVLILTPMRNDAYDVVSTICALAVGTDSGQGGVAQVGNRERFEEEFGGSEEEEDASEDGKLGPGKPADWKHRFRGNTDDDFKLGVSLMRKSVKLYSDFYESDVIVASPLGLVRAMEAKKAGVAGKGMSHEARDKERAEEEWSAGAKRNAANLRRKQEDDSDDGFLSSIEVCVIDGADVFGMQNWALVQNALEMVNNLPASQRSTDFSRVRQWALDSLMRVYRQTIVLTAYPRPDVLALFRGLQNHTGRVRLMPGRSASGSISDVIVSARQRFLRVSGDATRPAECPERRLAHFMNTVLPELRSSVDCQAIVVVPSYFDFVQVRNKLVGLAEEELTLHVVTMSEYSKASDVARAKTRFFTGKAKLLVLTERLHYYWRSRVRGANTIVWYSLPENAHFYPEIVNFTSEMAEKGRPVQSIALYDVLDALSLERIVGSQRRKKMLSNSSRSAYLFT